MKTASEISAVTNPAPIQGFFASLRERLASRPDTEHQAAVIRIVIALIAACYLVLAMRAGFISKANEQHAVALIAFILSYSLVVFISILVFPQISVLRRILSIAGDLGATSSAMFLLGDAATPFFGMYLFNACGNGFRYGMRYLLLSSALGISSFTAVLVTSEYWAVHQTLGIGLLIILIVIPMYFASLVQQLHAALERMHTMANHDTLTGLPNRHFFYEQLKNTLINAEQNSMPFAVVFVDLDGFKPINDVLGHAAGDAVLKSVARRLEENVRKNDLVARYGGDEFVIILSGIHKTAVPAIARKIVETVAMPHEFDGESVALSSSVGIATFPGNGSSLDELITHADTAMYRSKRAGRNYFCLDGELHAAGGPVSQEHEGGARSTHKFPKSTH